MARTMERIAATVGLIAGRLRIGGLRLRGASVGRKSSAGPRFRVTRPYCIQIGTRCDVEQDVYLKVVGDDARLVIGDHVFLGRGCEIDVAGTVTIGSHTLLAPNVFITDHEHKHKSGSRVDEQGISIASVTIGSDVWIGTGSVILPGITIGDGAIIGACSVVTRNVDANSVVAGVPARFLRARTD